MIITLSGKKGSGKSKAARYISNWYCYRPYALAQPLKDALKAMFGYIDEDFEGETKEEIDERFGISIRLLLQTMGTEWGQYTLQEASDRFASEVGREIWVRRFQHMVWIPGKPYVISDVRFQHEIDALRKLDKVVSIRIFRDSADSVVADHPSEEMSLTSDYIIMNNGDVDSLKAKIDEVMEYCGDTP